MGQLDAPGLAPAADRHLGLYDHREADGLARGHGLVDVDREVADGDRDGVGGQDALARVFEEIHRPHTRRVVDPETPDPAEALAARRRVVLVTAVGAVLAAALLFALVARAMSTSSTTTSAGGDGGGARTAQFDVGRATDRAQTIARSGPILFPDPKGGSVDIYVQHLGEKNWVAFEARARGASRQCVLRWDQAARHFTDPCDGRVFPADGAGLVTFPATVNDKGRVVVDLSSPRAP